MKHLTFTLIILLSLGVALAKSGAQPKSEVSTAAARTGASPDEQDEIRKTYQLNPGARVRVSGINGPVTIETTSGTTAEVYIERTARNREDLEYHKITIDVSADHLTIRGENEEEGQRSRNRNVHHRVNLKLPARIDLAVSGVNGPVNVAEIEGKAEVSGINGSVNFAQAATFSNISGINGKVTVGMSRIGEGGLHISGINGTVECRISEAVNADLRTSGVNGGVHVDLARVTVEGEMTRNRMNAKIGEGGPPITVSGINGGVHFKPMN
ncbi:MAG TPA: Hsp20/alpha crystallin family protein [Blastocatellia bacterium]|nr:Hsp20/alpha crystallin family protein [Blastocatellia bacterium]